MKGRLVGAGWSTGMMGILVLLFLLGLTVPGFAAERISLVIDQVKIEASPAPVIDKGRTLVPVRLVSEELGASVEWNEEDRTVHISKGQRSILLRIDNRLVDFQGASKISTLTDVPPQIIVDRTYVPLRLISNALGIGIDWDGNSRTVYIDSSVSTEFAPFFDIDLLGIKAGQTISGLTKLQFNPSNNLPTGAVQVRFQLLDPETGRGPVIARSKDIKGVHTWLPDSFYKGQRVLVAAVYDNKDNFLGGTAVPIHLAVIPQVKLTGIQAGQTITDTVGLGLEVNFLAEYVKYEITNLATGKVTITGELDPQGPYNWTGQLVDNGETNFRVTAYDRLGQGHSSSAVTAKVNVAPQLTLRGVTSGAVVDKPVTLWLSRNYATTTVEYLLKNKNTGAERSLAKFDSYVSFQWFPGPVDQGQWEVVAKVKDTKGNSYTSNAIGIQVPGTPKLLVDSLAPNQVLTGVIKLKSKGNQPLASIEYHLLNTNNQFIKKIGGGTDVKAEFTWTPSSNDAGNRKIQAVGTSASGSTIKSDAIPVRIFLGKIYTAVPIIEKDQFLGFASEFAVESQQKTDMSAALQTAQAILETGWGQQTPVDKYTGQRSYNLFGIKGTGPAGSVTSNTWEEYNGNTFRVDAQFRAYQKPIESWDDHKRLLLTAARYQPYREVMHNSVEGAWALRRAGYATDSQYPLKLINIIKQHNLHLLDERGI